MVGAAGDLAGRPGSLGRHRARHPRRAVARALRRRRPRALHGRDRASLLVAQAIGTSATTSTRSSSAARASCPGRWRSTPTTAPSATSPTRPFTPPSSTSSCGPRLGRRPGVARPATAPSAPPGLFALYVAGYCAFRIVEELLRVDPAVHVLGLRWNLLLAVAGPWSASPGSPTRSARPRRRRLRPALGVYIRIVRGVRWEGSSR